MKHRGPYSHPRGSVLLVALCFVAVLSIALTSYLALCSRAMTLSNRGFQSNLGQQLAEAGIEEALRAFNKNDWSDWTAGGLTVDWDTTTYAADKRAVATIAVASAKLGQGASGTVKVRVDNIDVHMLGNAWASSKVYRINDAVSYNNNWYHCVRNHTSSASILPTNLGYWAPAPIPTTWITGWDYTSYDTVYYNSSWYRCHTAHTSSSTILPTDTTYWYPVSAISLSWTSGTSYSRNAILYNSGAWYYCITTHTASATITPSNTTYWAPLETPAANTWSAATTYSIGNYAYYSGKWYRYYNSTSTSGFLPTNGAYWAEAIPYISWCYISSKNYGFNDVVYSGGTWYRCKVASSSGSVPTSGNWENALTGSPHAWASGMKYQLRDTVYYSADSKWYRCIRAHTSGTIVPSSSSSYWADTPPVSIEWDPGRQYSQNDVVLYKGIWFLSYSTTNHTNSLPMAVSSTRWAAAPSAISAWSAMTYYEFDNLVSYAGVWYRCIRPNKNRTPSSSATYWTVLIGASSSYVWNVSTTYSNGNIRSYGGVWYKYINATPSAGNSPNNTTYWTPTWAQSDGYTTGAPVAYAEATINLPGHPVSRTQLRALLNPAPLFPNAIGATGSVVLSSGGTISSYDNSIRAQNLSTGVNDAYGYADTVTPFTATSTNVGNSAVIASTGTTSPSLTVTSPTINGRLAVTSSSTSPYAPLASFGSGVYLRNSDATVTSPHSVANNVDLTRISRSPYVPQFTSWPSSGVMTAFSNADLPKGLELPAANVVTIGTPGSFAPSRYHYNGNLVMGGAASVIQTLNIIGPVVLYINGSLTMNGTPNAIINMFDGASAEIHIGAGLNVDAASDGIKNAALAPEPKRLILICDTSGSSTLTYNEGTNPFYGLIYAPNTSATNGVVMTNTATQIYGAISAKKITFDNNTNVHYDISLRHAPTLGVEQPWTASQWRELSSPEFANIP